MTLSNSPERTDDVELFLKKYMPWVSQAILLERQLQRRFGDLPFIYEKRIADADIETLLHLRDRVFDAETLEDVFS